MNDAPRCNRRASRLSRIDTSSGDFPRWRCGPELVHGTMSEVDAIVDDYRTICRSFRELDMDFIFEL